MTTTGTSGKIAVITCSALAVIWFRTINYTRVVGRAEGEIVGEGSSWPGWLSRALGEEMSGNFY
jgi:hypothetical protein